MEPTKLAMKAALRVLTALSERREPARSDVDELNWYAPADCERPLDEVACDAIQRALRDREQVRKATRDLLRETALASRSVECVSEAAAEVLDSQFRQEHRERQLEYIETGEKLRLVRLALQHAAAEIDAVTGGAQPGDAGAVEAVSVDFNDLHQLLARHARLARLLVEDERRLTASHATIQEEGQAKARPT